MNSELWSSTPSWFEFFLVWYAEHWILGTIIVLSLFQLFTWPFRLVNRFFRSRNIKNAGWPPMHVDADGDHKEVK